MTDQAKPARPASTVLLVRDPPAAPGAFEIFMLVRHRQIEFASGALVFPGGSVDAGDREIIADPSLYDGVDGLTEDALAFRIAGLRETFEESGILLARRRGGAELIDGAAGTQIALTHRAALCEGKVSFAAILREHRLTLALDLLVPYAHWITPEGMPKRFDTWFFMAKAPPEQLGRHDGKESTDSIWVSPQEALDGSKSGRFTLPFPTTRNLIRLAPHGSADAALEHARAMKIVTVMPQVSRDGDKRLLRIPADAGYDGELFEFDGRA
jgi:8-oxo-dGTP pyrophosphatase MutT (NUDIX family)